jgi:hypothetical protein
MAQSDPTKDPEFRRVLGNLLSAPPKPHSEMKLGRFKRVAESKKKDSTRANKKGGRRPSKHG